MEPRSFSRLLHWLIAVLVLGALATGYAATRSDGFSLTLLRFHLVLGGSAGILTMIRVGLWVTTGAPKEILVLTSRWEVAASRTVHAALRLLPLLLLASGVGMLILSGMANAVLEGTLSDLGAFEPLPPRNLHHAAAFLLALLIGLHVLAALRHSLRTPHLRRDT